MEGGGSRYVVFVKLYDTPAWFEHLAFFTRFDAETYASALKTVFSRVEDYCILERAREERRFG